MKLANTQRWLHSLVVKKRQVRTAKTTLFHEMLRDILLLCSDSREKSVCTYECSK